MLAHNKNSGFPGGSDGKEFPCNEGDLGSIPGLGRSSGGGHDNSLQYSCLETSPWTEEPGGLQAMGSQRVRHDWASMHTHTHTHTHTQGQGRESPAVFGNLQFAACCWFTWNSVRHSSFPGELHTWKQVGTSLWTPCICFAFQRLVTVRLVFWLKFCVNVSPLSM